MGMVFVVVQHWDGKHSRRSILPFGVFSSREGAISALKRAEYVRNWDDTWHHCLVWHRDVLRASIVSYELDLDPSAAS